jgi:hypothetical protein
MKYEIGQKVTFKDYYVYTNTNYNGGLTLKSTDGSYLYIPNPDTQLVPPKPAKPAIEKGLRLVYLNNNDLGLGLEGKIRVVNSVNGDRVSFCSPFDNPSKTKFECTVQDVWYYFEEYTGPLIGDEYLVNATVTVIKVNTSKEKATCRYRDGREESFTFNQLKGKRVNAVLGVNEPPVLKVGMKLKNRLVHKTDPMFTMVVGFIDRKKEKAFLYTENDPECNKDVLELDIKCIWNDWEV